MLFIPSGVARMYSLEGHSFFRSGSYTRISSKMKKKRAVSVSNETCPGIASHTYIPNISAEYCCYHTQQWSLDGELKHRRARGQKELLFEFAGISTPNSVSCFLVCQLENWLLCSHHCGFFLELNSLSLIHNIIVHVALQPEVIIFVNGL